MKLKRITALLLTIALLLSCVGCVRLDENGQPMPTPTPAPIKTESELFEEYLMDGFREEVGDNIFDSRFMLKDPEAFGITDIPLTIGSIDFEKYDNAEKLWQEDYDELTAFNYKELTEEQQMIYDLMKHDMDSSKDVQKLSYLDEYNSPLLGIQSQLPSLLPEYKLYSVQDAYDYITMLEHIPEYFDDMLEFQRRKSERGVFMSDTLAEELIKSCENIIAEPEKNALVTGFPARLEGLPDITAEDKEKLTELNRKAFVDDIVPAYQAFIEGMRALLGTGTNEGGLSGLEGGKKYYEFLVKDATGSDRSVTAIAKMLDDALQISMSVASYTVQSDPGVWDRFVGFRSDYGTPQEIMKTLESRTARDFPKVDELNYAINEIAPELEEHSSPAFFIIPQIDDPFNSVVYINNKYVKDDALYLFTTLAHEGYPGHMYQNSYFSATKPHPMRRLLSYSGYSEGWASYVEDLAYDMAGIDDPSLLVLLQWNNTQSLLLSSRADVGVNYQGWGKAELKEFLDGYGYGEDSVVENVFNSVVQDPANYLSYSVGMLEMQQLRRYAEGELEGDFDAMAFHRAVLDVGPAPFSFVEKSVDAYIDGVKAESSPAKAA